MSAKPSKGEYVGLKQLEKIDMMALNDKVQRVYEMLREYAVTGCSVTEVSREYGYSRTTFYEYYHRLNEERSLLALADRPRGPKNPSKVTKEVEDRIVEIRKTDPSKSIYDIADQVGKEGIAISHMSVSRVLKKRAFPDSGRGGSRKEGRKKERG